MQKRTARSWAKVFCFALVIFLSGVELPSVTAQETEVVRPLRFTLTGPDSSFLLAKDYLKTGLHLDFSLRYEKPGVVLDTVGINAAPVGSWAVSINGEGKLTVQVYDPGRQSPNRVPNGWHLLTSTQALAAGQLYRVVLDFAGEAVAMQIGDAVAQKLALTTPLSGQPVWVGDFPGDDRWGPRYNIHPAFTGVLIVRHVGSRPTAIPTPTMSTPTAPGAPPTLNLPTPGAILAEARIGPDGGQIKAGAALQIDIPAGALARSETIKVRAADHAFAGGVQYFVERAGQGTFNQPVRVTFTLPQGVTAGQVSAVHQLSDQIWQVVPVSFDPATRKLTMRVRHFSLVGWLMNVSMRTWVKLTGAGVTTTGGVITLLVFGAKVGAAVSNPATAFLVMCAAAGWFAAEPAYDAYRQRGLVGPMRAVGFDIFWEPEALATAPRFTGIIGPDGKVHDLMEAGAPAGSVGAVSVPRPIFQLAGQLQGMKEWYRVNGYTTPDNITVLVHSKLGKSKEPGQAVNAGEWDGKSLSVNIDFLKPNADQSKLLATLPHEYWHAIFTHNGYKESFVGADDCLATTFESMVFPGSDDFIKLHSGLEFGRVIASGLPEPAGDEGYTSPEMRGYALWPWGQFVYSSQGHEGLRAIATGSLRPDLLSNLFVTFSRAVLAKEHALPDPDTITQPDGNDEQFRTGWNNLSFGSLGVKYDPLVTPGRLDWPRLRPLSMKRLVVEIPKRDSSQPASRLVVRRRDPDPQEQIVLLKPAPAGSSALDIERSLDDLVTGTDSALAATGWTDDAGATVHQPVLLVGKAVESLPPMLNNYLLAYRLAAPTSVTAEPLPATATQPARTKVSWSMAEPGKNLKTHDCFAGYRLLGKTKKGEVELIAELIYGPAVTRLSPPQWYRGDDKAIALNAGQYSVELPATQTAAYETLGLQTIDGMCREGDKPALSAIAWPQDMDILAALRRTTTFYMRFTGAHMFETTDPKTQTTRTYVEARPWVISGGYYPGQKLLWNDRNFSLSWRGPLKTSAEVFEAPSASGASDADWAVELNGSVDGNGNLISAKGKVTRTGQGYWDKGYVDTVTFTLHDLQISGKVIEPNRIGVNYWFSGPNAAQHIRDIGGSRTITKGTYNGTDWNSATTPARVDLSFSLR